MTIEEQEIDCDGFSDDSDDEPLIQTPGIVRTCSWCENRDALPHLQLVTSDGHMSSFCSDECYSGCKNQFLQTKICDRCKKEFPQSYTKMIISEPSIQAFPLQFCTDQCLNRYKMDLFCMEVQEQLLKIDREKIKFPKPAEQDRDSNTKIMITPDLWQTSMEDDLHNKKSNGNFSIPLCLERRRKSSVVENVISKLSKRHDSPSNHSSKFTNNSPTSQPYTNRWQDIPERIHLTSKHKEKPSQPIQKPIAPNPITQPNLESRLEAQSDQKSDTAVTQIGKENDSKKTTPNTYPFMPLSFVIPVPVPLPFILPASARPVSNPTPTVIRHDDPE